MYLKRNKELDIITLYSGNYKAKFYLRQISKLAKLPLKTCQNALINLEKERILKSNVEGKNKYFSLNRENIQTRLQILHAEIHKTIIFLSLKIFWITVSSVASPKIPYTVSVGDTTISPDNKILSAQERTPKRVFSFNSIISILKRSSVNSK